MISSNKSPGDPNYSDETILQYFVENPDATIEYARQMFRAKVERVRALRTKAREILAANVKQKKVGETNWREYFDHAKNHQRLHRKSSFSQDHAVINIQKMFGGIKTPIVIQPISDLHIGALGANYDAITEITEGLLSTPNLFWILNGDLAETTAVFKNALAVHSQVMSIEEQHAVLESWLNEIAPKVISAGWCNHGVEREEKHGAFSHIKQMLNRRFIYHNGMGRIDIEHGNALYKMVVTHKVSGASIFNRLHGLKRLMRLQFPDVDMGVTGDLHTPDCESYFEGRHRRACLMSGSTLVESGYAKRYFSLYTQMFMPSFVLWPDEKWFGVYMSAGEALAVAKAMVEPGRL